MSLTSIHADCGYTIHALAGTVAVYEEIWLAHCYDRDFPIKPGMTVVDVGANQGFFSLYAAKCGAIVHAFEPEPRNFAILERNIKENGLAARIFAHPVAIGKHNGDITFYVPHDDVAFGSVMVTANAQLSQTMVQGRVSLATLPCITLAHALRDIEASTIDLLKLDCEGAELDILAAAKLSTLTRVQHIVMETHPAYTERMMTTRLTALGYHITRLDPMTGRFGLGFLVASRQRPAKTSSPWAIVVAPGHVEVERSLHLDGRRSCTSRRRGRALRFDWMIDGVRQRCRKSHLRTALVTPGQHEVSLCVSDGKKLGRASKTVWAMVRGYGTAHEPTVLGPQNTRTTHHVDNERWFVVSTQDYPRLWLPARVTIQIYLDDSESQPCLCWNGVTKPLTELYTALPLDHFPADIDIHFSIQTVKPQDIGLYWWADAEIPHGS